MAKNNNKGFSLIEIVIAMAVLTLLLTPIIKQFAQTMKVSRQAKEQQYINEEASFSLEEGQTTPYDKDGNLKEYEAKYIQLVNDNPELQFTTSTNAVNCTLVNEVGMPLSIADESGNLMVDEHGNTINHVEYKVDTFELKNLEIGPENSLYNRVMTVDNLATEIRGCRDPFSDDGFAIKYNILPADVPTGYTLTNEGSAVIRDDNGNVISVVVEKTKYVGNPNNTNLGNMQDLDYEKVAMINGTATNFDDQAEKALFSMAMDKLKEINYEEWENGMLHSSGDNILRQHGYEPSMTKLTKIYVADNAEPDGTTSYTIKADVFYYCSYTLDGEFAEAQLSYNVFAQTFKTEKCPDIYFEYQPFVVEMAESGLGSYDVTYAADDFILIDNYVETEEDGEPKVKLYIYKPHLDAINVASGTTINDYEKKDNYTYTTIAPSADDLASEAAYKQFLLDNSVAIHVAKANDSVSNVKIFTNLNTEDNGDQSQFFDDADAFGSFTFVKSDNTAFASSPKVDFDKALIKPISEDTRYDDRLRTVTITLIPIETDDAGNEVVRDDANTVILTGPKGEK